MIKIAVIEDEKPVREYLAGFLKKQIDGTEVEVFASAEDFCKADRGFDLLFLDIEMDGMNGMELAEHLRSEKKHQPLIIFVTGYEAYVYQAFDVYAFHYLLKPFSEEKLTQVFHRAIRKIQQKKGQYLQICCDRVSRSIAVSDIYYLESANHKIRVHTASQVLEYYGRMSDLEHMLQGTFFRIHKGYLIHLAYVESYTKTEVVLTNGANLLISKYKYEDFVKAYLKYLERESAYE